MRIVRFARREQGLGKSDRRCIIKEQLVKGLKWGSRAVHMVGER